MTIFLPPTDNPASNPVNTGSYTVPAGFWAKVTVVAEPGENFTVDGNTVLSVEGSSGIDRWINVTLTPNTRVSIPSGFGVTKLLNQGNLTGFNGLIFTPSSSFSWTVYSFCTAIGTLINGIYHYDNPWTGLNIANTTLGNNSTFVMEVKSMNKGNVPMTINSNVAEGTVLAGSATRIVQLYAIV